MIASLLIIVCQLSLVIAQGALLFRVTRIQRRTRQTLEQNKAVVEQIEAEIETLAEYRVIKERCDNEFHEGAMSIACCQWLVLASLAVGYGQPIPSLEILKGERDDGARQ